MAHGTIEQDGQRVDDISQNVIVYMYESDKGPWTLPDLARTLMVEPEQKLHYRFTTHLQTLDIVERTGTLARKGSCKDAHLWQLTERGEQWVCERREQLDMPKTIGELMHETHEARKQAESAHESVQSYRKKLHREKKNREELEEQMQEIMEQDTVTEKDVLQYMRAAKQQARQDLTDEMDRVDSNLQSIKSRLDEHREALLRLRKSTGEVTEEQAERIDELQAAVADLRQEIDALDAEQEEQDSGGLF